MPALDVSFNLNNKNIVFIGFMGSGKSSVARRLSEILGLACISLDEWIEKKENSTIAEIFNVQGEPYFRQREAEAVKWVAHQQNQIVDCGGGVVLLKENMLQLKQNGIIFYLSVSPSWAWQRLKSKNNRPLLNAPDPQTRISQLIESRKPFYEQSQYDHHIDTDGQSVEQTTQAVLEVLKKYSR